MTGRARSRWLLLFLARIAPSETVDELIRDTERPWLESRRTITVTAFVAIVSVAFRVLHPWLDAQAARLPKRWIATAIGTALFAALAAALPLVRFSGHADLGAVNALVAGGDGLQLVLPRVAR